MVYENEVRRYQERAEARRRQILDAAEGCFRARGFHAATMAEIAAGADLSVGQIYRFFENKEAVVAAITGSQMEQFFKVVAEIETRDGAANAIRAMLAKGYDKLRQPGVAAMMLEITAEASRNPAVAAIVHEHDRQIRQAMATLLAKAHGISEADAMQRAEMVSLIFEGAAARVIRNPEFADEALDNLQAWLEAKLLSEPDFGCPLQEEA